MTIIARAMNINIIIFSVLISVICVLLTLVQYYYKKTLKKPTYVIKYDPYFKDLIVTHHLNWALDYEKDRQTEELVVRRTKTQLQPTDSEVEQCLKAASTFRLAGKLEKAFKLYEHAASLAPQNADVLTKYGEFLEEYQKDVISADQLYVKALSYSPEHAGALANRERTSTIVDQMDLKMFDKLDNLRNELKAKFRTSLNYEERRNAFYLHIYHSVGIEGNTMTLTQLRYLLETGKVVQGKSIVEHNEILGLDIALHYVKAISGSKYIEIDDILEIHKRVMGHVDPLEAGTFRREQVFVGSHIPPPPEDIHRLMGEYVDWLNSEQAYTMHPVRLAALAHYKLVDIHPFSDGNGRTSRLIMNLILLKFGYPPVMIYKEDRQEYYDTLNKANMGDVRPFVRFIAYCTEETLNTYLRRNNLLENISRNLETSSPVIEIQGIKPVS